MDQNQEKKWIKINIAKAIYDNLKMIADVNHRSVKGQVEFMIENAFRPPAEQAQQTTEPESAG